MRMEELRGYFWPQDVWKRVRKDEKPPCSAQTIVHSGRKLKGYLLDETYGRPVGTIAMYGEESKYVQKAGVEANIQQLNFFRLKTNFSVALKNPEKSMSIV